MHHHANSARQREGDWGRVDGILRSAGLTARRTPSAPRGGAADDQGHVVWMEGIYWNGSGHGAEVDGRKQW